MVREPRVTSDPAIPSLRLTGHSTVHSAELDTPPSAAPRRAPRQSPLATAPLVIAQAPTHAKEPTTKVPTATDPRAWIACARPDRASARSPPAMVLAGAGVLTATRYP